MSNARNPTGSSEPVGRDSAQPSRTVLDGLLEGVQIFDSEFRCLYLNTAAARHLSTAKDELIGRSLVEQHSRIEGTPFFAALQVCMRERSPSELVSRQLIPSGASGCFRVRFEPVPEGVAVYTAELGDWGNPTEACKLRESEERYRLLLQHAPVGIAVQVGGKVAFTNPAGATLLGYASPEELVGTPVSEILDRDALVSAADRISRMRRGETGLYPVQDQYTRKDGSLAEVEVMSVPMVYEGQPAVQLIVSDIAERQRTQKALAESEKRFRALFEYMTAGFMLLEVVQNEQGEPIDMIIRAGNPGFEETTGLKADAVVDRSLIESLPGIESDAADWIGRYGRVAITGEPRQFEQNSELLGRSYSVAAYNAGPGLCAVTFSDVTAQKQAADALREQEARFKEVFEAANVGKSIMSVGGDLVVNEAFAEMLGYEADEIRDKTWRDLTPEEDFPVSEALIHSLLSGTRNNARLEKRYLRKDGTTVWGDLSAVLVRDSEGKPSHFIATIIDVSRQRAAADALRASEHKFSGAFFASPAGMTITRIEDGRFVEANDSFLTMVGYSRDEVLGKTSAELGILTSQRRSSVIDRYARDGELQNQDLRVRGKSGEFVDIVFSSRPIRVGEDDCLIATMIDVTQERASEAARRTSEDRYRRLAENLPDVVWRAHLDGTIQYINRAVSKVLGYLPDALVNQPMANYLAPASQVQIGEWLRTLREDQPDRLTFYAEVECLDIEGETVPCELHAVPILGEDGVAVAIEGVARDIRKRKQLEMERSDLQAQLQLAQKLESVGQLAGGVAHDFNNLLSVILSYADFAAEALQETDPVRADISEIQKAGARAASLTRQLLAFSRKQILEPTVLDINALITGIDSMLNRLLAEDVEIKLHLTEPLNCVLADAGQIERVIMNLAVNARDAMPRGGALTIETAAVHVGEDGPVCALAITPGHYVEIAVSDTGTGMSAEDRDRIFEPFFTTKDEHKGTGLGLATVYGIVKQSGGAISVSSELGQGTTFRLFLPVAPGDASSAVDPSVPTVAGGGETVLVVEDESAVRQIAERILVRAGYDVYTASGGESALRVFEQPDCDVELLLTDVVMPGMSGRAVFDQLAERKPSLKVLYMSGYTDQAIVHRGVLERGTRFIGKPFSVAELTRAVREALDED